jgi:surface protein
LAYACYNDGTLTFYYDGLRSSREGTTYALNTSKVAPDWYKDGNYAYVTKVIFDPSFADARPTSTFYWFGFMSDLQTIEGMSYLNTSKVAYMGIMFYDCSQLTSLDLSSFNTSKVANMFSMFYGCSNLTSLNLSSFNTSKVADMCNMFYGCTNLRTIYVGDGWSTASAVREDASYDMFSGCTSLVGGQGTTYNANHVDKTYAHIDGEGGPGYFTARTTGIATDLHQVTSDKQQVQSDEWYTIDGRKLNGKPAAKGIYIQNGQKQIIK